MVAWLVASGGGSGARHPAAGGARAGGAPSAQRPLRATLVRQGELPSARQDAASAPDGRGGVLLMGGLDGEEASLPDVLRLSGAAVRSLAPLPAPLHDACAAEAGGSVFLFGGGVQESFSAILRVGPEGGAQQVGSLPTPASDVACVSLGGTVYVIGGYTGREPLRSIVAWRPGSAPRVVGELPKPLRYAAAGAVGGRILIAGGTSGELASADVYSFDPASGSVRAAGRLPVPLTHAAGVAVGGVLLVLGGRGAQPGTQRSSILAVSASGRVSPAGRLPEALSDVSAAASGAGAVLAGGLDRAGAIHRGVLRLTVSR